MRKQSLALLFLAAFAMTAPGCRQTTGTIAGGPAPAGSLSPVNPSQQPILGPFGGNTRVTPPATGSYQPTGGYIGASSAPIGQPSLGANQPAGTAPIGSGVQVAGWTETNSVVPTASIPSNATTQVQATDPRSGGMHVNDLTGAPAPPGYRGSIAQAAPIYGAPANYAAAPQTPLNQIPSSPNSVVIPQQQWQQQSAVRPTGLNPISPTIARAPIPAQQTAPAVSQIPATTNSGPSTEPINSGSESGNLMWRRPGSQF